MEDQVNSGARWKQELVSNSPNLLQNLERAEELEGKFVARTANQGRLYVRLELQVHHITNSKGML